MIIRILGIITFMTLSVEISDFDSHDRYIENLNPGKTTDIIIGRLQVKRFSPFVWMTPMGGFDVSGPQKDLGKSPMAFFARL